MADIAPTGASKPAPIVPSRAAVSRLGEFLVRRSIITSEQLEAVVRVGATVKSILVYGDRRCTRTAAGGLTISSAEPITAIPLCYTHAYGGRDAVAEALEAENYFLVKRQPARRHRNAVKPNLETVGCEIPVQPGNEGRGGVERIDGRVFHPAVGELRAADGAARARVARPLDDEKRGRVDEPGGFDRRRQPAEMMLDVGVQQAEVGGVHAHLAPHDGRGEADLAADQASPGAAARRHQLLHGLASRSLGGQLLACGGGKRSSAAVMAA